VIPCVIRVLESGMHVTGPGDKSFFVPGFSGDWGAGTPTAPHIRKDVEIVFARIQEMFKDEITDEDDIHLHISHALAQKIGLSAEHKAYILSSPDGLAAITDEYNPHRKHGLAPYLYGLTLRVEGCRYPNPELVRMVRDVSAQLLKVRSDFCGKFRRVLYDSAKDMPSVESPSLEAPS
jgi:hypothetical protein